MSKPIHVGVWGLVLVLSMTSVGCGKMSFVGRRFDDFTAYYNTFYNAQDAFEQGVDAMQPISTSLDRSRYLTIFGGPPRSGGNINFQNAIEKSANVLRGHGKSKWVDDALLLIGKSYFYQENYVGAEQKFREVIDLQTKLEDEARVWLARTLIAAGAYDDAREHLVESLAQDDLTRWSVPRLHVALGELYVRQGAFGEAAAEIEAGVEGVRDHDLRGESLLLLGQVYETLGRYDDAVTTWRLVRKTHPRYEVSYAAEISAVRVQGMYGDPEEALEVLRRMQRDDKHYDNRSDMDFVQGRIYQAQGWADEAREVYEEVLYDSDGNIQGVRGPVHYALGELYRDMFGDYIMAAAHFDTARTAMSGSASYRPGSTTRWAPEAITDVREQAETFQAFARVRNDVTRMDSLLELGYLDQEAFDERILEIRRRIAEELLEQQRQAEQFRAERSFRSAADAVGGRSRPSGGTVATSGEAGFLYHRSQVRIQEARMDFIAEWGERPLAPNWRRIDALIAAELQAEEGAGLDADASPDGVGDSEYGLLPPLNMSEVPRDTVSQALMESERALARYELGNVLFLSMNQPDSAAAWYTMVVEENPEEVVAQRAYYALAEVHRSLGDSTEAQRLYEDLLNTYPDSDFAMRVLERLGLEAVEVPDTLTLALEVYDEASAKWREGSYSDAFDRMIAISADYRDTEVAPKALLAAGQIYMEWAASDSLDVFQPLSVSLPDSVFERAGISNERPLPQDGESAEDTTWVGGVGGKAPTGTAEDTTWVGGVGGKVPTGTAEDTTWAEGAGNAALVEGVEDATPAGVVPAEEIPLSEEGSPVEGFVEGRPAPDEDEGGPPAVAAEEAVPTGIPAEEFTSTGEAIEEAVSTGEVVEEPSFADSLSTEGTPTDSMTISPHPVEDSDGGLLASIGNGPIYLETVYSGLRDLYPSTEYAQRARDMLDALEQIRIGRANADSMAAAATTDSLQGMASDPSGYAAADSLGASNADSGTLGPASPEDQAAMSPGDEAATPPEADPSWIAETPGDEGVSVEESLYGQGSIHSGLVGYTIQLGAHLERAAMEELAGRYAGQGFRTGTVTMTQGNMTIYQAVAGHFSERETALSALERIRDQLEAEALIVPLGNP